MGERIGTLTTRFALIWNAFQYSLGLCCFALATLAGPYFMGSNTSINGFVRYIVPYVVNGWLGAFLGHIQAQKRKENGFKKAISCGLKIFLVELIAVGGIYFMRGSSFQELTYTLPYVMYAWLATFLGHRNGQTYNR